MKNRSKSSNKKHELKDKRISSAKYIKKSIDLEKINNNKKENKSRNTNNLIEKKYFLTEKKEVNYKQNKKTENLKETKKINNPKNIKKNNINNNKNFKDEEEEKNVISSLNFGDISNIERKPSKSDFFLFDELKDNLKSRDINCQHSISESSTYCFDCRCNFCNLCSTKNNHIGHNTINTYIYYLYNTDEIDKNFILLDENFKSKDKILDKEILYNNLILSTKNKFDNLIELLNKVKENKLNEITEFFNKCEKCYNKLKENENKIKNELNDYFSLAKQFYNIDLNDKNKMNIDYCNTSFLINYDLLESTKNQNEKIINLIEQIEKNINGFQNDFNNKVNNAEIYIKKLNEAYKDDLKIDELNNDFYEDIFNKINSYKKEMNEFKKFAEDDIEEINTLNKIFESNLKQNMETLLKNQEENVENEVDLTNNNKKKIITNGKIGLNNNLNINSNNGNIKNYNNNHNNNLTKKKSINSKDNNLINNLMYRKYFTYKIYDLVYKKNSKNLNINSNLSNFEFNINDYDIDSDLQYIKPIQGTNELQIYEPSNNTIIKRKPKNFENIPFNYFLIGCRSIFLYNKLFISGGVDKENKPTKLFLFYNIQTNTLKCLKEMPTAHAYHSIYYIQNYECIVVIGGESSNNCEVYDLKNECWYNLPNLNFCKANSCCYYDRLNKILYSFFGIFGNLTKKKVIYSDCIEKLRFNNIKKGWEKIDYTNKTMNDLKKFLLKIYPINSKSILIYGVNKNRENKKTFAVYDKINKEIVKMDSNTFIDLRNLAKKSKKLSKIIQGMNLDNIAK